MTSMTVPEPVEPPTPPDLRRWSERTHRLLFALSGLFVLVGLLSFLGGGHFFLLHRLFPEPLWFMCAATIPQAVAAFDEDRGQRSKVIPPVVVGVLAGVTLGALALFPGPAPHIVSATAPNGDITAVFTTEEGSGYGQLDLHQNDGLLARVWYAGCLNGEKPDDAFVDMAWTGATTLEVRTRGGQHLVVSTDSTGRPGAHVTTGENLCR